MNRTSAEYLVPVGRAPGIWMMFPFTVMWALAVGGVTLVIAGAVIAIVASKKKK